MTDETFLSSIGGVREYSLMSVFEETNTDAQEHQPIPQSSYYDTEKFNQVASTRLHDFSILTTNVESLNAKFDELVVQISELNKINFKYNAICLQETWLSETDDMAIFNIDGYNRISQGKTCGNKGGLTTYIDNRFEYEIIMNLNMYKHWEGLVIKVKGDTLTNPFVICNIYRPPRSTIPVLREFLDEITPVINTLDTPNHNVILAGDFNINILKVHENILYSEFIDLLMSHSLSPKITLPTRLSTNNGTLIDNIFCKPVNPLLNTCAGIHINRLSDHQPCFLFINIHIIKPSPPKLIQIYNLTQHSLLAASKELKEINLCTKLDKSPMADADENYNIMYQDIQKVMNKYTTTRTVKYDKHKHKKRNGSLTVS